MSHIQDAETESARQVAKLLVTANPEQTLRDAYIESLTGSSLQSQSRVTATLAALGLEDHGHRELFRDSQSLNPLFKARHEIAHEMDMTVAAGEGPCEADASRAGHRRYVTMCHTGLNYCQRVLNCLEARTR